MERSFRTLVTAIAVVTWLSGGLLPAAHADPAVGLPPYRAGLDSDQAKWCAATVGQMRSTAHSVEKPLGSGWNLVSLPIAPSNPSIAQVLAPVGGQYELVSSFDASGDVWFAYNPNAPGSATLLELGENTPFWIKMTQPGTLTVSGSRGGATAQQLSTGWNLVGYSALESREVTQALDSISGHYTMVYGYQEGGANPWQRYCEGVPDWTNTLTQLEPGYGYWVYVSGPCTLRTGTGVERLGFAVNAPGVEDFDTGCLGGGWYHNWGVVSSGLDGVTFVGTAGAFGRTVAQEAATIEAQLAQYPERYPDGMVWLIGNEIGWDDGGSWPAEYAQHYHDWYLYLKGLNPTFQIGTGALFPLWGAYSNSDGDKLTGIWWLNETKAEYLSLYGEEMPIDWYNIHVYLGPLPNPLEGLCAHIEAFREAMTNLWDARSKPLIITETGNTVELSAERTQGLMVVLFDYLRSNTSDQYGCTSDGNRMVQKWAWFSLTGWTPAGELHRWDRTALFDYETKQILPLGETYAQYAGSWQETAP